LERSELSRSKIGKFSVGIFSLSVYCRRAHGVSGLYVEWVFYCTRRPGRDTQPFFLQGRLLVRLAEAGLSYLREGGAGTSTRDAGRFVDPPAQLERYFASQVAGRDYRECKLACFGCLMCDTWRYRWGQQLFGLHSADADVDCIHCLYRNLRHLLFR